jgi:peptidylglycine monooxygenase
MAAGRQRLRVALGADLYEVERPFGDLAGRGGKVTDVAVDLSGHVHVLLRRDPLAEEPGPAVVVLDADGRHLGAWGEEIADAHMIACDPQGRLWVVDRDAHEIVAFDAEGRRLESLGHRHAPGVLFNHPADVAFGPGGDLFVADGYGHGFVHRFDRALTQKKRWGGVGVAPGTFLTVHGIWACADGRVVVVDRENDRLQVFDGDGALLGIVTGFYRPSDIWGDAAGRLYVTDAIPTLTRLAPDLTPDGRCRPVLNGAHGLWGGPDGMLYLAEGNPSRITRLVPVG